MDYVSKVIMSCKTPEQLDSCEIWIKKVFLNIQDVFVDHMVRLDYQVEINQMRKYLTKKGVLNEV